MCICLYIQHIQIVYMYIHIYTQLLNKHSSPKKQTLKKTYKLFYQNVYCNVILYTVMYICMLRHKTYLNRILFLTNYCPVDARSGYISFDKIKLNIFY